MKRVVIVYERAGQGHVAAAEMLRSILGADDVEVVLQDGEGLESPDPRGNPLVAAWNWLIRRGWFGVADLLLNHWLRLHAFPFITVAIGPVVKARLKALNPDAVVTTADIYSRALGDAAEDLGIPFTVFPIELSVFADILHPAAHHLCYFEETASAIRRFDLRTPYFRYRIAENAPPGQQLRYLAEWFCAYGVLRTEPLLFQRAGGAEPGTNALVCHIIGPLREPADHAAAGNTGPGRPRILVASGSIGGRFVHDAVRRLLTIRGPAIDLVAMCGRDEQTLTSLQALAGTQIEPRLECHGYVNDMPARLRSASLLLARPSASLFLEAILAGVPLLIPARTTKNDSGTVELTRRWGIGEVYDHERDIKGALIRMLPKLDTYRRRIAEVRARYPDSRPDTAERIRGVVWRLVSNP